MALHQVWLAHRAALSAWTGGGFGMFSSTDAWGRRHLHAYAIAADGTRRELPVPELLGSEERRALALPDARRLRTLALALAELEAEGVLDELAAEAAYEELPPPYVGEALHAGPPHAGEAPDAAPPHAGDAPDDRPPPQAAETPDALRPHGLPGATPPAPAEPAVAIAIEVFAVRYDRASLGPSGERIAALEVPLAGR